MSLPRRGTCRGCGHPVVFAQSEDQGMLVLEAHESASGPDRYVVWDEEFARPINRRTEVRANAVHKCPAAVERRFSPLR